MAKWFYILDGQEAGPIESVALKQLADSGRITPDTKVRRDDLAKWNLAKQIKGLFPAVRSTGQPQMPARTDTPATCSVCPEPIVSTNTNRTWKWAIICAVIGGCIVVVSLKGASIFSRKPTPAVTDAATGNSDHKRWIGLKVDPIKPDSPLRAQIDVPANQGLLVTGVVPDSPAALAGLKTHDILLRANDVDLHDVQEIRTLCESQDQVTLQLIRNGRNETVYVKPEEQTVKSLASTKSGPRSWDLILTESEMKGTIDRRLSLDNDMTEDDFKNIHNALGLETPDGDSLSNHTFRNALGRGIDCSIDLTLWSSEQIAINETGSIKHQNLDVDETVQIDNEQPHFRKYSDDRTTSGPRFAKRKNSFHSPEIAIPGIGDESFCHEWAGRHVVNVRVGRVFFDVRCKQLSPAITVARAQVAKLRGEPVTFEVGKHAATVRTGEADSSASKNTGRDSSGETTSTDENLSDDEIQRLAAKHGIKCSPAILWGIKEDLKTLKRRRPDVTLDEYFETLRQGQQQAGQDEILRQRIQAEEIRETWHRNMP